jgi:hypothetical protein
VAFALAPGLPGTGALAAEPAPVRAEVAVVQRYVWRGLDLLDGAAALQPAATLDPGRGWYAGAWASLALDRGGDCREIGGDVCRDWDELDLYAGGYGTLGAGRRWQGDWDLSLTYFAFYEQPRSADTLELGLKVSHPALFGTGGPVPRWAFYYSRGAERPGEEGVWVVPGVGHTVDLAGRRFSVDAEATFKDGDAGLWRYSGLTHATLGVSTAIEGAGWTLRPRVRFQQSLAGDEPGIRPYTGAWIEVVLSRGL